MAREAMDICLRVLKESNKSRFDSYSVRNSVLLISHATFRDCRVPGAHKNGLLRAHIFPTTFLEIAVCDTVFSFCVSGIKRFYSLIFSRHPHKKKKTTWFTFLLAKLWLENDFMLYSNTI